MVLNSFSRVQLKVVAAVTNLTVSLAPISIAAMSSSRKRGRSKRLQQQLAVRMLLLAE
jgi:predicted MarR family transcription regulator